MAIESYICMRWEVPGVFSLSERSRKNGTRIAESKPGPREREGVRRCRRLGWTSGSLGSFCVCGNICPTTCPKMPQTSRTHTKQLDFTSKGIHRKQKPLKVKSNHQQQDKTKRHLVIGKVFVLSFTEVQARWPAVATTWEVNPSRISLNTSCFLLFLRFLTWTVSKKNSSKQGTKKNYRLCLSSLALLRIHRKNTPIESLPADLGPWL